MIKNWNYLFQSQSNADVSNEIIKILAEKRILLVGGNSMTFSEDFSDMIMRCIHNVKRGKRILRAKILCDTLFHTTA